MNILQRLKNNFKDDVLAPIGRAQKGVIEALNPFDEESKGNNLINSANQKYHFTPQMKQYLDKTNPYVGTNENNDPAHQQNTVNGYYNPKAGYSNINSRLRVVNNRPDQQNTLLHEGLHAAWDEDPQARQDFISAYNKDATPEARTYLLQRMGDYEGFKDQPSDSLMNLSKMSPNLQTEVHSYLSEFYNQAPRVTPPNLKQYYSRYYGAPVPAPDTSILSRLKRLF